MIPQHYKHNIKDAVIGLLLFAIMLGSVAVYAEKKEVTNTSSKLEKGDRFAVVYKQEHDDTIAQIIQDKETGKKYFFFQYYQSAGLVEIK